VEVVVVVVVAVVVVGADILLRSPFVRLLNELDTGLVLLSLREISSRTNTLEYVD
jgi:hypothetical protein